MQASTLLLHVPVPLFRHGEDLYLEAQACNGLRLWADNFDRVIVTLPRQEGPPPPGWLPIEQVGPSLSRIQIEPLPMAYRPDVFMRTRKTTARRLAGLIKDASHLCFAIGGLFGDWGAVACIEASRLGRPYAVWTDRVESEVVRRSTGQGRLRDRVRASLTHRPMARLERRVIKGAALGLFHGQETFDTYAPFCGGQSEMVHDIHVSRKDHIPEADVFAKLATLADGPLQIRYAGRIDHMKGPLDWVAVLEKLHESGVAFHAIWHGDGPLRPDMEAAIERAGLSHVISLPGFTEDRETLLNSLRQAHVFLFCHKTPESPRCLIEALLSGAPIIGYDSPYPRDLMSSHGGGALVALDDVAGLAARLAALADAPEALSAMIKAAVQDGAQFDDVSVFRHRSDLIKQHLSDDTA